MSHFLSVRELLNISQREPVTIEGEASVYQCLELMAQKNIGAIPILSKGKLCGIFSERDYARKVVLKGRQSKSTLLKEVMTAQPKTVTIDDSLESCMQLMSQGGFRHLIVMDGAKVLGMISVNDVVAAVIAHREELISHAIDLGASALPHDQITKASVLLASDDRKEEVQVRMALGGTGVSLSTASSIEEGKVLLQKNHYDILCVNTPLIDLAAIAREKHPNIQVVYMTEDDAKTYFNVIRRYPFLSNIVARNPSDRTFTVKSTLATVSKLAQKNYFGMEKYLSWGVEIQQREVKGSEQRRELIEEMKNYLRNLGIRQTLVNRCSNVAEELLFNAIYDAPTDSSGKALYNHLDRSNKVELKENEQATFRYGCDGMFLAISVDDPFGSIKRDTILDHIEKCSTGEMTDTETASGGGGHGIYIIFQSAHLVVFNVKESERTEVIALFDLEPKEAGSRRKSSLHYFKA